MATWIWIVIIIAVVAVVALAAVAARNRRTAMLRDRFGPEYDRTVANRDDRRAAEAELLARQKQRAQFDVKPLPEADRLRFAAEWRDLQERFLDEPAQSVGAADALITRVMEARGYPMRDFDSADRACLGRLPGDRRELPVRARRAAALADSAGKHRGTARGDAAVPVPVRRTAPPGRRRRSRHDRRPGDQAQPASLNGGHRVTPGLDAQVPRGPCHPAGGRPSGRGRRQPRRPGGFRRRARASRRLPTAAEYRDQQIGR